MRTANNALFSAASLGASFNSDPVRLENMTHFSAQIVITAASTLNGTFTLEGSNDAGQDVNGAGSAVTGLSNWTTIGSTSQAVTADGSVLYNIVDTSFRWIRVVWTRTAGSATATCRFNAKGPS